MKKAILTGLILIAFYTSLRIVADIAYAKGRNDQMLDEIEFLKEATDSMRKAREVEWFVGHSEIKP
ncbi:MAG TPA: hypothetical protein VD794_02140 [Flavisolibacter sp.]|nr:hypothetical protein [Flavisolibacter sp.]